MSEPIYISTVPNGVKVRVERSKNLGNGTAIIDYDREGVVCGVEFIPATDPMPLVPRHKMTAGYYWFRETPEAMWETWCLPEARCGDWLDHYPQAEFRRIPMPTE